MSDNSAIVQHTCQTASGEVSLIIRRRPLRAAGSGSERLLDRSAQGEDVVEFPLVLGHLPNPHHHSLGGAGPWLLRPRVHSRPRGGPSDFRRSPGRASACEPQFSRSPRSIHGCWPLATNLAIARSHALSCSMNVSPPPAPAISAPPSVLVVRRRRRLCGPGTPRQQRSGGHKNRKSMHNNRRRAITPGKDDAVRAACSAGNMRGSIWCPP